MENRLQIFRVWTSNLALTQVQAIVVSFIAAIIAHLLDVIHNQEVSIVYQIINHHPNCT
jgi:hypothetical protein